MFVQDERKIYIRSYSINPEFTDGVKGVRLYAQISEVDDKMLLDNNVKYLVEVFMAFDDFGMRNFISGAPINDIENWSEEHLDKILQKELECIKNSSELCYYVKQYQHFDDVFSEHPFEDKEK